MKTEQKLVIKIIDSLASKHGEMSFTYEYNECLNEHLVEVEPLEKFNEKNYLLDEVDVIAEFIASFPDKALSFISNDPYIKVENPIYQTGNIKIKSGPEPRLVATKPFWPNLGRRSQH